MVDTVTTQKLVDNSTRVVYKLTNISDGTGENGVLKIDASELSGAIAGSTLIAITRVMFSVSGGKVLLTWDGGTPATALVLTGTGHFNFDGESPGISAPVLNNATTPNGDVKLTTSSFTNASGYTIIVECRKSGYTF